jgi:hypothetical protein
MKVSVEQLAGDLQGVLDGTLSPGQFRARNPIAGHELHLEAVLCRVEHYFADADIRGRDSEYRDMQDADMRKLIAMLRSGRLDDAARIDFFGNSR